MSRRLCPYVSYRPRKIPNAQRSQIVSVRPPQASARHHAVAVGNAGTGALQSLNESRDVDAGREFQHQVQVVSHDAEFDHPGSVPGAQSPEACDARTPPPQNG